MIVATLGCVANGPKPANNLAIPIAPDWAQKLNKVEGPIPNRWAWKRPKSEGGYRSGGIVVVQGA